MRSDIVPGAIFPDYELADHTAKRRKLSEPQGQDPMVLVLSRGGFCPKDRRQAEGLVQLHRELDVGYCRLGDGTNQRAGYSAQLWPLPVSRSAWNNQLIQLRRQFRSVQSFGKAFCDRYP